MGWLQQHTSSILDKLPAHRLLAIDALRGITITAMILVNNPGSWAHIYSPLEHAHWHGWTPTDLIFPFFIFIVGISISISIDRQLASGHSRMDIIQHAVIRSLKLFLLGWFLALFYYNFRDPDFSWVNQRLEQIRILGVLQRIALVYFCSVLLVLGWKTIGRAIWMVAILLGYWLAMTQLPYADSAGNVYQGLLEYGNNLSAWLDNLLMDKSHLYYPDATPFAFDPEGVLSTLPAIAGCLSGVLVGQWLTHPAHANIKKANVLLLVGIIAIIVGECWSFVFPINKALWTSSFVMLSSGYACFMLGALLWLIDIKRQRSWTAPFVVFGANSIAFFMFAGIVGRIIIMIPVGQTTLKGWLYSEIYQPLLGNLNGSLAFAISFLIVSYLVMYQMYRRGIFWKV